MEARTDRIKNVIAHPWTEYQVTRAKNKHRKGKPVCALCGVKPSFFGRANDVHHRVPVHVAPGLACEPDNLITLCRVHHWLVGHGKNWRVYNDNLSATIRGIQASWEYHFKAKRKAAARGCQ